MDSYDLNDSNFDLEFPFGEFLCDEPSESSSAPTAHTIFSTSIGGQYSLNGASLFDSEYIDPAMLMGPDTTSMDNSLNGYTFPASQDTQNEPSPFQPKWQSPATDFEELQNNFQDIGSGAVSPNALDTSAQGDASFDSLTRLEAHQAVHGPMGNLAFSQKEHFE
jgi:hypothetical protein